MLPILNNYHTSIGQDLAKFKLSIIVPKEAVWTDEAFPNEFKGVKAHRWPLKRFPVTPSFLFYLKDFTNS